MPYFLLDYSKLLILAAFVRFRKFGKDGTTDGHRCTRIKLHDATAV
jgi:hypothetical protein